MASPGGAAQRADSGRSGWWIWLLVGAVLGVLGTVFLPGLLAPYLPSALRPTETEVAGVVQSKSAETDRLLLTVGSDAGATLVTFTKDVARFDQFIGVGDSVRLAVREYSPFIDDPEIRRVMKASDWQGESGAAGAASGTADDMPAGMPADADSAPPAAGMIDAAADAIEQAIEQASPNELGEDPAAGEAPE